MYMTDSGDLRDEYKTRMTSPEQRARAEQLMNSVLAAYAQHGLTPTVTL
jgi:hypothetical protein